MGSSRSSAKGWSNDTQCACARSNYFCEKVRWKSVPMCGQGWATTGRIASLGITEFWHKGRQYSHDVIELWVRCKQCRSFMYKTMQFSKQGKQLSTGRYQQIKSGSNAVVEANVSYSYDWAVSKYNQMPNSGYQLTGFNCKSWARQLWNKL